MPTEPSCPKGTSGVFKKWFADSLFGPSPAPNESDRRSNLTSSVGQVSLNDKVVAAHRHDDAVAGEHGWWLYYKPGQGGGL
jgi:hypothetical protein